MNLVSEIKTAPAGEPFDFTEIKNHTRIDNDTEDDVLRTYMLAAIDYVENFTWRVLRVTTFTGFLDDWDDVEIHKTPVTSITSVKYFDENDVQQTLPTTDFRVNLKVIPATITFDEEPTLFDKPNAIEIEYIAGYAGLEDIPNALRVGLYICIEQQYDFRTGASPINQNAIEMGIKNILGQYNARTL